ncbi:MAG TPA: hypothetical protein VMW34_04190, partial [Anaerolineales bacterium]|nr:hypothetical protein [Anaerolineales bacterium]
MATRWYTDPTNTPDVSPAFSVYWEDTTQAVRRKLVIDTPANVGSTSFDVTETYAARSQVLAVQFVSEPLDAIDSVFAVT